jgi:hypothetical protein
MEVPMDVLKLLAACERTLQVVRFDKRKYQIAARKQNSTNPVDFKYDDRLDKGARCTNTPYEPVCANIPVASKVTISLLSMILPLAHQLPRRDGEI